MDAGENGATLVVSVSPTATQEVTLTHDTALIAVNWFPVMLGLGTVLQVEPFHCCTNVEAPDEPTLMQNEDVTHETPSVPANEPGGAVPT
jgi:hypothetical protein